MNNIRLDYIDIAKALGMFTIMWGHIRLSGWSFAFVYGFHIPLFFFLSGMVFDRNRYGNFRGFLLKKTKSLLIPYVVFSFLFWLVWASFSYVTHANVPSYWKPLAETFIAQGSGGFLVHNVPLWFVTCLFVVEAVYYFISKFNWLVILIICTTLSAISWYGITNELFVDWRLLPWNIEVACLMMPVFAAGQIVISKLGHDKIQMIINHNKCLSALIACVAALLLFWGSQINGPISFGHVAWGKSLLLAYATGLSGTAMMIIVCILLACSKWNANNVVVMDKLKWFGKHSFDAMAIHNPIKGFVCIMLGYLFHCSSTEVSDHTGTSLIAFVVTLFITIICMNITIKLRRKSKSILTD